MEELNTAPAPDAKKAEEKKPSGGPLTSVWEFFASLKLTIFLMMALALVSIFGTVIDQTDPGKNMKMLIDMFGPANAPGALKWMETLGLTDMYRSPWFVLLLLLLSANITICTIERLPGVFKMVFTPISPVTENQLKSFRLKSEVKLKGDMQGIANKVAEAVKSAGFSPQQATVDGDLHVYAEKGRHTRLGVYVTHASFLIIFFGALIGIFFGYKGYAQIMENNSATEIGLTNRALVWKLTGANAGESLPIPFSVRCDKFELKKYAGTGMPSDYLSTLTIVDGGKEIFTKTIRVNDPMEYKGIRFFQSSYGVNRENATMTLRAYPADGSANIRDYKMRSKEKIHLEGSSFDMILNDMAPDVAIGQDQQLIPQSDQFNGRGAALVAFYDANGQQVDAATILGEVPDSQPKNVPFRFQITDYNGPYYTGLQVTHDPGVWVVYIGCILMVLGILVAFFLSHQRVWVRIRQGEKGQVVVTAVGNANKNKHVFETDFRRMLEKLGA